MTALRYSPASLQDLRDIRRYITEELGVPDTAGRILQDIVTACEKLAEFPQMGAGLFSVLPLRGDYRYLVCGNYLVFYRINGQCAEIHRVLYRGRDYLRVLFGRLPADPSQDDDPEEPSL